MLQVFVQNLIQVQDLRLPVHQGDHNHAVAFLQLRMFVEPVQNDLRIGVFFQFNDNPHTASAGGFIPDIGNTFHPFVLHQFGDFFDQSGFIHLIRDFRYDNLGFSAVCLFNFRLGTNDHLSLSGFISVSNIVLAHNNSAGREVRSLYNFYQIVDGAILIFDHFYGSVNHLRQIMGRNGCRHADGDTIAAVY